MAKRYRDIKITKTYGADDIASLADLGEIISMFSKMKDVYIDIYDQSYGGGDADIVVDVSGVRPETDAERDERLKKARDLRKKQEKAKADAEQAERDKLRELLTRYPDEIPGGFRG